jgi:GNAT superfamily N-acetyltransferase
VGTIRLTKTQDYYKLSRLAVLKNYRKHRFGRELVLALHDLARNDAKGNGEMERIKIVSHSQIPVKGFYLKCALGIIEPSTSTSEQPISSQTWVYM